MKRVPQLTVTLQRSRICGGLRCAASTATSSAALVRDCPKARADRTRGANQAAGDHVMWMASSSGRMSDIAEASFVMWRGVAMAAVKYVETGAWVLDSGASHHNTNDASTKSDIHPLDDAIHITNHDLTLHPHEATRARTCDRSCQAPAILCTPTSRTALLRIRRDQQGQM